MAFLLPHYLHLLYQLLQNWQHSLISGHEATWKDSWESAKEQSQGKGAKAEVVTEHRSLSGVRSHSCLLVLHELTGVTVWDLVFYLFVLLVWFQYFCA